MTESFPTPQTSTTQQSPIFQQSPPTVQQGPILPQIPTIQENVTTQHMPTFERITANPTQSHYDILLADFDVFDTNFSIEDSEMDAVILNSTQEFWMNFPGEVEMYG
jgi:hypothetical protein